MGCGVRPPQGLGIKIHEGQGGGPLLTDIFIVEHTKFLI